MAAARLQNSDVDWTGATHAQHRLLLMNGEVDGQHQWEAANPNWHKRGTAMHYINDTVCDLVPYGEGGWTQQNALAAAMGPARRDARRASLRALSFARARVQDTH